MSLLLISALSGCVNFVHPDGSYDTKWLHPAHSDVPDCVPGAAKAKAPFDVTKSVSPPLSVRASESPPARPAIVPPTVKVAGVQFTTTELALPPLMVPVPALTTQLSVGLPGWVSTVTA